MYRLAATSWVALEALINEGIEWACKRCRLMGAWFNRVQSEGAGAADSGGRRQTPRWGSREFMRGRVG